MECLFSAFLYSVCMRSAGGIVFCVCVGFVWGDTGGCVENG